ncbi:YheC/YheD family protein [Paenibacillus albiflavus]|uniref:YheC/YheD family protein n=1 Tax=Paenibacillus albiflavus TaxID=2545760 RepID=UPI0014043AAF|nr:YheC/YheD family protein [Paenibacillus albiflavus]
MPRRKFNSYIPSKWAKTKVLNKHSHIQKYIPTTSLFSKDELRKYLNRYRVVFIKPDTGSKGKGILQAEIDSKYHLKWNTQHKSFRTYNGLFSKLKERMTNRKYVIQKGIHLLTSDGRPFDFRVMIQRNKDGVWEESGIIGRLASKNKIVTNGAQGATLHPIHTLLEPYLSESEIDGYVSLLYDLGKQTAKKLRKKFPDVWEIGMDVGIDNELRPWIIEVNTRPEYEPLSKLEDKTIYRKLVKNWKYKQKLGYKRYK